METCLEDLIHVIAVHPHVAKELSLLSVTHIHGVFLFCFFLFWCFCYILISVYLGQEIHTTQTLNIELKVRALRVFSCNELVTPG